MKIADQTLKLIDDSIVANGGSVFRVSLQKILPEVEDIYREDDDGYRSHIGGSVLGSECAREIWYDYRWFGREKFSGRMTRLLNRGHMEEARFIAMLVSAGMTLYQHEADGKQMRVSLFNGHFGGSLDGVAYGVPEVGPGIPVLTEFKTHNENSFKHLQKKGLYVAKREHFVQMTIYMYLKGLEFGLYLAVNKNTDELYGEIITLNREFAQTYLNRARYVINSEIPPARISAKPSFFGCSFCTHKHLCHMRDISKVTKNCRNCKHSTPLMDPQFPALWGCRKYNIVLDKKMQSTGCQSHELCLV